MNHKNVVFIKIKMALIQSILILEPKWFKKKLSYSNMVFEIGDTILKIYVIMNMYTL